MSSIQGTVLNRIGDDALYSKTYPQMTGSGTMEATQELHIFLNELNPSEERVQRYYTLVNEWNDLHPNLTDKMKACYLALVFRDPSGAENTVSVMQSARYLRSNDTAFVVSQAHEDAKWFADHGFTVIREKIEATAYGIIGIPNSNEEMEKYPTKYFEFHIKVGRIDKTDTSELTETEIDELKSISKISTERFQIPIPLSYNKNADKMHKDGLGYQRFLNARFRNIGFDTVKTHVRAIESEINSSKAFRVIKTISEYVWYDSLSALDHGWIDYSPEELQQMFQKNIQ